MEKNRIRVKDSLFVDIVLTDTLRGGSPSTVNPPNHIVLSLPYHKRSYALFTGFPYRCLVVYSLDADSAFSDCVASAYHANAAASLNLSGARVGILLREILWSWIVNTILLIILSTFIFIGQALWRQNNRRCMRCGYPQETGILTCSECGFRIAKR